MDGLSERIAGMIFGRRIENRRLIVAIDGRCAAGKTTLAERLQQMLPCTVFHMDDYFLRPEQQTAARLDTPGGNVDHERFYTEILGPLVGNAERIVYRPYDCRSGSLKPPVTVRPGPVCIVEGSYSCHPALWDCYDLRIFLTVSEEEQMRRIRLRNGDEGLILFRERWIPLEEKYFRAFRIEERCDIRADRSDRS